MNIVACRVPYIPLIILIHHFVQTKLSKCVIQLTFVYHFGTATPTQLICVPKLM